MIEIVLAVGIIAFALVAILGLFPIALDSASTSQRETQAAFIARSIFNDLLSTPGPKVFVATSPDFFSNSSGSASGKIDIDLTTDSDHYIAYSIDGEPMGTIPESTFTSGSPDAGYLAVITVTTGTASSDIPGGLARVEVQIETPAVAPRKQRDSFPFVSLLNQNLPPIP